jgi:hypothetical protein
MAIHGVKHVPKGVLTGVSHARYTIRMVLPMYQTDKSIGVKVASMMPTGVIRVMNGTRTVAIVAQMMRVVA